MTADGWCKTFDCPPEEYYRRLKLGEPPPTRWERRLYLEWFSQNGRVVLELAGPIIEFQDGEEWKTLPPSTPKPDEDSDDGCPNDQGMIGLEATMITCDGEVRSIVRKEPDAEEEVDDFQDELDAESEEIDELIQGDGDVEDFMAETELMDDLITQEPGERIADFLDEPMDYPDPDSLTDEEAESALKTLLARMAIFNIALDMCEHFTPRDAYRLLVTDILLEDGAFPQLRGTGWVTHHSTAEYCKTCEELFDREYDEKMKSEGVESHNPDSDFSTEITDVDDLPF